METKGKAIPLSREDRDAKKTKINVEDFLSHIDVVTTSLKRNEILKQVKK